MNDMKIFENPEFGKMRTINENGTVMFVASDVAKMLGYKRPADAISAHCKGSVKRRLPTNGGTQEMKAIPEGDVYRLIVNSKLPAAERFESWVFDEVLPSIRKNGGYIAGQDTLSDDELMARALLLAQRVIDDKTKQITEMKPKADFYDTVANTESLFSMADVAKTLDMGIGRNKLFAFLRDKGILDKYNHPYQKYVDAGYMRLIENHCKAGDNDVVYKCTYVKQKGIDYIRKILLKERGLNDEVMG